MITSNREKNWLLWDLHSSLFVRKTLRNLTNTTLDYVNWAKTVWTQSILRDSLIKDMIIIGLRDKKLKERLLRENDIKLEKVLSNCRASEVSKLQTKSIFTTNLTQLHRHQLLILISIRWSIIKKAKKSWNANSVLEVILVVHAQHTAKYAIPVKVKDTFLNNVENLIKTYLNVIINQRDTHNVHQNQLAQLNKNINLI